MKLKTLLLVSTITTPLFILIMVLHGAALKIPGVTPHGIIDLELAGTMAKATRIYDAWHPDLITRAMNNTYVDFLFILSYGVFLYSSVRLTANLFNNAIRKLGRSISVLMIIAAILDVLENVLMISTLSGHFKKEIVATTFIFASIKFILVAIGLSYIIISLITRLFLPKKNLSKAID